MRVDKNVECDDIKDSENIDKQSELSWRNESFSPSLGVSEIDLMELRNSEWNSVMRIVIGWLAIIF